MEDRAGREHVARPRRVPRTMAPHARGFAAPLRACDDQRMPRRCFALTAASDCGNFAINSSSVRRAAALSFKSDCADATLSSASGTLGLVGYVVISTRCAEIDAR